MTRDRLLCLKFLACRPFQGRPFLACRPFLGRPFLACRPFLGRPFLVCRPFLACGRFLPCRNRAFTLAEAILTVFLCSIVFAVTAQVLHEAHRSIRHQRSKVAVQQGVQLALSRISAELREALTITQLGSGVLEFSKVDASLSRYASAAQFAAPPLTVRYQLQNGRLTRQVMPGGQAQRLAEEVYGFTTSQLPNKNILVTLSFRDSRLVQTYDMQVSVPSTW